MLNAVAPLVNCVYLPGRNAVRGGIALALLSFAALLGNWALTLVGAGMGALFVLAVADFLRLRLRGGQLQAWRTIPICVGRGVGFHVGLRVRNLGTRPVRLLMREVLPEIGGGEVVFPDRTIPAGESVELTCAVTLPQRGRYLLGGLWVREAGFFGMVDRQYELLEGHEVKVYPEGILSRDELVDNFGDQASEKFKHVHKRGEGMEFDTLSRFQPGDDVRHIDWRSSARHRSLLVRRHQIEQHRDVVIILDCGRLMGTEAGTGQGTKLDRAVDSALLLSEVALARGDRCGFGLFDDRVLGFLPPQGGNRARQVIMETIFDVQSEFRESNFGLVFALLQSRQRKRALVVVLSDIVDGATSDRFRGALAALARSHVVVFAALRTPLLEEYVRAPVSEYRDVCQKAVALRLEREREKTLCSLSHAGVRVLDVDPRALTAPLINEYLALRAGNLL